MKKRLFCLFLPLLLLCSCATPVAKAPDPTPEAEVTPTPAPTPSPEPTEAPFAWVGDQEKEQHYATLDGLAHMPLDELPQEVRDSLELVAETGFNGDYPDEWGCRRSYQGPGLELTTTAPSAAYIERLKQRFEESGEYWNLTESCTAPEEFAAYIDGEEGREWITWALVSDDRYATVEGLKVGMTVEEAEKVGYPLRKRRGFAGGFGPTLEVTVEQGRVTALTTWWDLGRYIGKFWEM